MIRILFLVLATFGVANAQRAAAWLPLFSGVDHAEIATESPRKMRGHAIRIDTRAAGISFFATPDNGAKPGETDGVKTSTFLKQHKLQAAINAAPFSVIQSKEGRGQDVLGLQIVAGKTVSKSNGKPALCITKDNRARIDWSPTAKSTVGTWVAVAGFFSVLRDGKVTATKMKLHPRTAVGVSKDKRYVYWLVIDGRQRGYSEGAGTKEVGEWLKSLGAHDGINLDGGGTTAMVIEEARGRAKLLNRPVHLGFPGVERVAASHLGLRAIRNQAAKPVPNP